jgi:hypothetical protein
LTERLGEMSHWQRNIVRHFVKKLRCQPLLAWDQSGWALTRVPKRVKPKQFQIAGTQALTLDERLCSGRSLRRQRFTVAKPISRHLTAISVRYRAVSGPCGFCCVCCRWLCHFVDGFLATAHRQVRRSNQGRWIQDCEAVEDLFTGISINSHA